jgi:hypothetical protein
MIRDLLEAALKGSRKTRIMREAEMNYRQLNKLATIEPHDAPARLWEAIILYNRGVLHARLGRTDEADSLLSDSLADCTVYAFDTLRWQVLLALGDLRGGDEALTLYKYAAEALEGAPPLTEFEFQLEGPDRADAAHSERAVFPRFPLVPAGGAADLQR